MKKIVLFSPCGYVGSFIKEKMLQEQGIQLFEMARDSDWEQYEEDYDILIYSASITSARHETADKYVNDNVVTAVSIMNFCKKHHVKRIIYLSSDEIYGDLNTDMVTKKTIMVNPNLYAVTKYLAEKIIIESNIPYYILRLPGVVGGTWNSNFICNLMNKICNCELVELYNTERKFNNIVEIYDLISFIHLLCLKREDGKKEILLLGNEETMKLENIVFYIKDLYHSSSVIHNVSTDDRRCFTLDVSRAVKYGYSSKKIKTIIDELYRIQKG